jgi:glutamate racemase
VISETVGPEVKLIDSGEATARAVEELLKSEKLTRAADTPTGRLMIERARERKLCDDLDHFYVTDAEDRFARVAERFLGSAPTVLEAVELGARGELQGAGRTLVG